MIERFIERGTDYPLKNGKLSVYETNCACSDIQFYFEQYVFTMMLAGHKQIKSDHLTLEFFPGTFFIPEKGMINNVSIHNASMHNVTKCLVLELNPSYIQSVYEDVALAEANSNALYKGTEIQASSYFLSSDKLLIQAFTRLYKLQMDDKSPSKTLIEDLLIREVLYRIFSTEALYLLKMNFENSIFNDSIRRVVAHIKDNIGQKLTTSGLANIAGLGQTTFFKVFKEATGQSPVDFIMRERIRHSKVLIRKGRLPLQEIAYRCGFNSYEYFCSCFKKIEQTKPSAYKKSNYTC